MEDGSITVFMTFIFLLLFTPLPGRRWIVPDILGQEVM